jgi:alkanesulfonate monooxygenase SsuD/methylene tetrahydromethanopterin reductase-like flavin-dependent oxidoreductase (luciferase family)
MFMMRFSMRSGGQDPAARAALYSATLEMARWGEQHGCLAMVLSQHHASPDGYLPSPVPLASAVAAVTTTLPINVAALLLVFYEPIKLAEDLAVVDLISRGRVSYVIGIGYRDAEFDMFGVDRSQRGRLTEERIPVLRRAWTGEAFEFEGRPVQVTPLPFTPGGPMLAYGGGTVAAARRAARLGMYFVAEANKPELELAYREEAERVGVEPLGCSLPSDSLPLTVFVADDPDRAWAELGAYMFADAELYGQWNAHRTGVASISNAGSVSELRAEHGSYQVLTPDEALSLVRAGAPLALQPLVGGLPPDLAWPYLEAAAAGTAAARA